MADGEARNPWYGRQRWRNRAKRQLQAHPLCAMCLERGIVTAAKVADHVVPHNGDEVLFWFGELQSLCAPHHSSSKAIQEHLGFSREIGPDGWPTDKEHPVYRSKG